jgi:protein required for attachment to host cells
MTTWILVADGSRAHLYAQHPPSTALESVESWDNVEGRISDHQSESDRLGSSGGGRGSSQHSIMAPETDPKDHAKQVFAHKLANLLNEKESSYHSLIVIAPPHLLGELRKHLNPRVQAKVSAEFNKDLTHVSAHDLPSHLEKLLAAR